MDAPRWIPWDGRKHTALAVLQFGFLAAMEHVARVNALPPGRVDPEHDRLTLRRREAAPVAPVEPEPIAPPARPSLRAIAGGGAGEDGPDRPRPALAIVPADPAPC